MDMNSRAQEHYIILIQTKQMLLIIFESFVWGDASVTQPLLLIIIIATSFFTQLTSSKNRVTWVDSALLIYCTAQMLGENTDY